MGDYVEKYSETGMPLTIWSLIEHENKMSVVNFALKMDADLAMPIKSKERLIFDVGTRCFAARPIFSEHSNANKQKFERFAQPGAVVIASILAPVQFPPALVTVYK